MQHFYYLLSAAIQPVKAEEVFALKVGAESLILTENRVYLL